MVFGMPTLIETESISDCAVLCDDLGLEFIELNMNLPQYQLDAVDEGELRKYAELNDIFYTIHLDENLNVSDFNPYIASAYRKTAAETIRLAKRIGSPVINMHLSRGVYFTLPEKKVFLFDEYREKYLNSMKEFRDMCEDAVGDSGVRICIENCDGFTDFHKEAVDLLLGSDIFGLTYDIGHNHSIGGTDEEFILERRSKLCHMHIHDARGPKNHMTLGSGEIDLTRYISLADELGCRAVIETKTVDGLRKSVGWLKDNIQHEYLHTERT